MTKIEEILNKYRDISRWPEYPEILDAEYVLAMKEYAENYAKKCLEIAAKEVTTLQVPNIQQGYSPYLETIIDVSSILNIKLPEHE